MRSGCARALLLVAGSRAALALAELGSRWLRPIRLHTLIAADGSAMHGWLAPGTRYRQVSSEYDALTTITAEGYRVPAPKGPLDVIFLGDSFTFGSGLADDETFAWPGGESYGAFRARVLSGLTAIAGGHSGQRVAVVTHAGVITQVLGVVRRRPASVWSADRPDPLTATEVAWNGDGPTAVLRWNQRDWY